MEPDDRKQAFGDLAAYEERIGREADAAVASGPRARLESAFPRAEAFYALRDVRDAVDRIFDFSDLAASARTMLDAMFIGLFPEYEDDVGRFAAGEGPQINEIISEARRREIERALLLAMAKARDLFLDRYPDLPRFSWRAFAGLIRTVIDGPQ